MKTTMQTYLNTQKSIFFIIGRGRSGTTMLSKILNTHPELAVAPEGWFFMGLYSKYFKGKWDQNRSRRFCKDLTAENIMRYWKLNTREIERNLLSWEGELNYGEAARVVYANYAKGREKAQIKHIGDKNLGYSYLVKHILRIYPDAKFIHMVRDYRDVLLSFKKVKFDSRKTVPLSVRWVEHNLAIERAKKKMPKKFQIVRYEDVLCNSDKVFSELCSFLGVNYDRAILEFHRDKDRDYPQWYRKLFDKLQQPLDRNNMNKWKSELPESDIKKADYICGRLGRVYGYQPRYTDRDLGTWIATRPGVFYGRFLTLLEKNLVYLPFGVRNYIFNKYREVTGDRK